MKNLILFLLALAISLFLIWVVMNYNGYVTITSGHYVIQTRLITALITAYIMFWILTRFFRTLFWVVALEKRFKKWREKKRIQAAVKKSKGI
jgi:uncharacterized protein HemY